LRERREDVPLLMKHFLGKSAQSLGGEVKALTGGALQVLQAFPFPGNVRQLENICHWITVMAPGSTVDVEDLPPEVRVAAPETLSPAPTASAGRAAIEYAPAIAGSASAHSSGYAPASAAATHAAPPRQYAPAAYSPDANSSSNGDWQSALAATLAGAIQQGEKAPGERLTREFEATMIRSALLQTKGRRIEASEWLGWGRNTLTRKIHELGLDGEV
jgi:two-component system nitrogen regulation response regulator GlnG